MSETIKALQLGNKDWNLCYQIPEYMRLIYLPVLEEIPKKGYDIVFIDREVTEAEVQLLKQATKAYTLFVTEQVNLDANMQEYVACKKGKLLKTEEIQNFITNEAKNYFAKPYGEKFNIQKLAIAQGFQGKVKWDGNYRVVLEGNFGNSFSQIVFWRYNIPIQQDQAIEFWLEYAKKGNVEIKLVFTQFVYGSLSTVQNQWEFTEEQLKDVVIVDNQLDRGLVFVSIQARGTGELEIIALHDRISRRGHGAFLPGGERYVTSGREEVFAYFDPGDMKPPLNVYFSGYKTLQGFEGYFMMRGLGSPYLLIAEPRLEGGCFYMGDEEYEKIIPGIIHKYMEDLGFTKEQVVLSGLSMGTFGALYYGCDILPHAIVLGKPLASIGDVAANERLHRPGGFPTSLDVLKVIGKGTDEDAVENLNKRFWDKFEQSDWSNTKFVVSYMIEDDYDRNAYTNLISHVKSDGVQLYGKGIHGRHNDDSGSIIGWFVNQYKQILLDDFGRRNEDR